MKKKLKRFVLGIALAFLTLGISFSQVSDIGSILAGGVDDAGLLMTEYIRPLANALGANLNAGWYNTAQVHKLGGFHINFTASMAFAPDAAKTYDLGELDLLTLKADPADDIAATFFGDKGMGPTVSHSVEITPGNPIAEFNHPGGVGIGFFPSPMINAGVGLPKGFEIMGRYMPTLKFRNLSSDLWGVGVKHDIGQWIPFVKRIPILDFTLQYGYTKLNVNNKLNPITPADFNAADNTTSMSWDNQELDLVTQGHTANFLVGANLPVVAFYGGVGISMTKTNLKLNGDFPVPILTTSPPIEVAVTNDSAVKDPLDLEIKNSDGGIMKPRLNAGLRFKFTLITLQFDYTYANYSVATAGLGISFR
jgi:hypothetical protein